MGFQQGLSGLNASSKNLEVIGNNVANANTFGAKASRAEFADMYANAMSGSGDQHRHRRHARRGGPAVHAGQHHGDRQPARPRASTAPASSRSPTAGARRVHAQRPVQGRSRRLHRQQPAAAADGLPGRCEPARSWPARPQPLQMPTARHHPGGDHAHRDGAEPRRALAGHAAERRRADRLRRPDDLQQRDLADGLRREGPGRRADLLLPEGGDRHLERLRRPPTARRSSTAGGNPAASTTLTFPANGGTPTAPVGTGVDRHPVGDQRASARSRCRSPASPSTSPARRSTARSSASPTCRRTAMPPAS